MNDADTINADREVDLAQGSVICFATASPGFRRGAVVRGLKAIVEVNGQREPREMPGCME